MKDNRFSILALLLPFLLVGASFAQLQEEVTSGDGTVTRKTVDSNGGIVIEHFAEGTEKFSLPSPSDFRRVEQQEAQEKREKTGSSLAVRRLSDTFTIIDSIVDQRDFLLKHGFIPEQITELEELADNYSSNLENIQVNISDPDSFKSAKTELMVGLFRNVNEVLLPEQISKLNRWNDAKRGLAKILLSTEIGEELGLSEAQRKAIRQKSQQIADEIEEFIAAKKKDAFKVTDGSLTETQKDKLAELISVETFDLYRDSLPLNQLQQQLDFKDQ
ncbi:hypothetical protein [Mariniblastus fucicola]|uniref:Uncharacterized protein n=1 Tax=Mariniblastus fucicola TaxID=980251 RepID=A0A5B9PBR5_9BACT|nr:hypothetical protein [Mariniblastus fucicola]QEG22615.1 hypothetical protein MFFC18_24980 [Mariniblastus fucicola]